MGGRWDNLTSSLISYLLNIQHIAQAINNVSHFISSYQFVALTILGPFLHDKIKYYSAKGSSVLSRITQFRKERRNRKRQDIEEMRECNINWKEHKCVLFYVDF